MVSYRNRKIQWSNIVLEEKQGVHPGPFNFHVISIHQVIRAAS